MKGYVYWSEEFKAWEVWFDDCNIPSQYFPYREEAIKYAETIVTSVEIGRWCK